MSTRRFDPALTHSAIAAAVVFASSVAGLQASTARDGRDRRESAAATAELVAARLETGLHDILGSLETAAASAPAGVDERLAAALARGDITAVARRNPDGADLMPPVGDAATLGPAPTDALDDARDSGDARLGGVSGPPGPGGSGALPERLVAVAPIYRGVPRGTAERRSLLDGYLLASVNVSRLLQAGLPLDAAATARLTDGGSVLATAGATGKGPQGRQAVEAGGRAYVLTANVPGAPARFPALPLGGAVLAGLIVAACLSTVRARRRAEDSADVRGQELSLLADLGALLQESLDLELILPAAALRLSEQLDLDGFAVLRADRQGRLVHTFSLGAPPTAALAGVAHLGPSPEVVEADTDALFPLQRGRRVTGALWLRPRAALDRSSVRSVHAAADLMAAALANAEAFDQERETVRRLEDLDRIKNRFIGTVSHEMRTSASAISGFANLLSSRWDRLDDEERRDLVTRIDRNGQSLVSVVEDFLDFSRLERRSPASDPPPASLSELVATAADDLATLAPQHRIVTRIADHVTAFVDRQAVERILANLVSNAAKYSPAGSEITITVDSVGDTARLIVDDEGSGIPPPEREKVFEPFYRAGHHAVAGTHGAGIGLAVVKEVTDRLRARVSVEDSPGGGARLAVAFRALSSPFPPSTLLTGARDEH